jgi:hypothetical protein
VQTTGNVLFKCTQNILTKDDTLKNKYTERERERDGDGE